MEIKKNKNVNLESKKGNLFLFGLMVSAGSILMAFEWINYDLNYSLPVLEVDELVEYEPAVQQLIIEKPRPKTTPRVKQKPIVDDVVLDDIPDDDTPDEPIVKDDTPPIEGADIDTIPDFGDPKPKPIIEGFTTFAEVMPEYPGGLESLYKDLSKKLKDNPTGMAGKIHVEFIVEKDGSISNVSIKKGLNDLLDQKSIDAVKSLKNWSPGEQNYHKVRVKMVLPINFIIRS